MALTEYSRSILYVIFTKTRDHGDSLPGLPPPTPRALDSSRTPRARGLKPLQIAVVQPLLGACTLRFIWLTSAT